MRDEMPDTTNSQKIVAIVQVKLYDGTLADNSTWKTVVLISKGYSGDFQGIGLVEVLRKTITILINRRFTAAIMFHDVLHRFWEGQETGTSALEAKLL